MKNSALPSFSASGSKKKLSLQYSELLELPFEEQAECLTKQREREKLKIYQFCPLFLNLSLEKEFQSLPFVIVFVFGAYHNCICIYCLTYLYAGHSIASPQKLSYGHNL